MYETENLTIDDLQKKEWMSHRALTCIKSLGIEDLHSLLARYERGGFFSTGVKTNQEIHELCLQYLPKVVMNTDQRLKELESLKFKGRRPLRSEGVGETESAKNEILVEQPFASLSVRAYGCLFDNGLVDIDRMLETKQKRGGFKHLKNCGTKTDQELQALCNLFEERKYELVTRAGEDLVEKISLSTPLKLKVFISKIEGELSSLSVRATKILTGLLGDSDFQNSGKMVSEILKLDGGVLLLVGSLLKREGDFSGLPNSGLKTAQELRGFTEKIIHSLSHLAGLSEVELGWSDLCFRLNLEYGIGLTRLEVIKTAIYSDGHIRLFPLLYELFLNTSILDVTRQKVFQQLYQAPVSTHAAISKKAGVSAERVRQIKIEFKSHLFDGVLAIDDLDIGAYLNCFGIDTSTDLICLTDEVKEKINVTEGVDFNLEFMVSTLAKYLPTHEVLEVVHFTKEDRIELDTVHRYLVRKGVVVDQKMAAVVFELKMLTELDRSWFFDIKERFAHYGMDGVKDRLLWGVAINFIYSEFSDYIDGERNLRGRNKSQLERLESVFESTGRLMKIEEIEVLLGQDGLMPTLGRQRILNFLMAHPETFLYLGKFATYGLKKWEEESGRLVKRGFVKDIVFDFIAGSDAPLEIDRVVSEVLKFRPETNSKSIVNILRMDPRLIISRGRVGLAGKTYAGGFKKEGREQIFKRNLSDYKAFVKKHGRDPRINKFDPKESRLKVFFVSYWNRHEQGTLEGAYKKDFEGLLEFCKR